VFENGRAIASKTAQDTVPVAVLRLFYVAKVEPASSLQGWAYSIARLC